MQNGKGLTPKFLFKITPTELRIYGQRSVYFTKPRLVAFYESNYDVVTPGKKILYFKEPTLTQYPFDLNDGYETHLARQSAMYGKDIELSLKYAMSSVAEKDSHSNESDAVDNVERTMVYTRRGTISHIMQSCYVNRDWSIKVSRYKGNIYMAEEELDESERILRKVDTHHFRLAKILFAKSPSESPQIDEPCDENMLSVGVHRSTLGKYDIIYSGEVQGIIAEEKFENFDDLEEFNKCRFVLSKQIWATLKNDDKKFLNYWVQAYLANVKDLYVGYKVRDGIIQEPVEHKIVSDLPQNRYWKPGICTTFLDDFIQRIEKLMSLVNSFDTVYVFHYKSNEKSIIYNIHNGKTDKSFITDEYIKYGNENFQ